jgi:hypothetical protein
MKMKGQWIKTSGDGNLRYLRFSMRLLHEVMVRRAGIEDQRHAVLGEQSNHRPTNGGTSSAGRTTLAVARGGGVFSRELQGRTVRCVVRKLEHDFERFRANWHAEAVVAAWKRE